MTDIELRRIYDEEGGDLKKIAARLNLPEDELLNVPVEPLHPPAALGRPEISEHIISVRHADNPTWPKENLEAINLAHRAVVKGTHTVCQGRDGDWFILYSIPRKRS